VLLIGPGILQSGSFSAGIRNILLAIDYHSSFSASSYAVFIAQQLGAELTVLHVVEDPGAPLREPLDHIREIEMQRMQKTVHWIGHEELRPNFRVRFGRAARQVLLAARDCHADLLVMGPKPSTHWPRRFPLSTAYAVLVGAPCPVLSIRAGTYPSLNI
jgi:nucleotide-binding universal stress UspA family protein